MKHQNCLVLNSDYSPIGIIHWKKAMVWAFRYAEKDCCGIEIIDYHTDDHIIGVNRLLKVPAVIKTVRYFKIFNSPVSFSRKNVFIRDDFVCQYCNKRLPINKLTYDHVIPRSQWTNKETPTSWTNIVTSCLICNSKKGNKTPAQANMPLKSVPEVPKKTWKYLPLAYHLHTIESAIPNEWRTYIGDIVNNAKL